MAWYEGAKRELPWRGSKDPWRVLLSEVMLQQTRVATVIPYYEKFLRKYPDAAAMARAQEKDVLAMWSGLGYYTRARNLHKAARQIAEAGRFPESYEAILELAGVGDYTAAAVASIVHGLPHAVADGNVLRVLSRLTAEPGEIRASPTRERLRAVAQELLAVKRPGDFNQALMELGATVCLPKNPQCAACPWRSHCSAHAAGQEAKYPVKLRPKTPEQVHLRLLVIVQKGRVLVWQRAQKARRMAGFWELPEPSQVPAATGRVQAGEFSHSITHHRFLVQVERALLSGPVGPGLRWIAKSRLAAMPLSTIARKALALVAS